MKVCKKCLTERKTEDFKKDKRNRDGLGSYCKECHNISVRNTYDPNKNRERHKKYAETGVFRTQEFKEKNRIKCKEYRINNPEKASLLSLKWAQKNREKKRAYTEKWRKSNLPQKAANAYLLRYIKKGVMTRSKICSDCLKECKTEAHHQDYTKPLEIIWLCRRCHMKLHRKV